MAKLPPIASLPVIEVNVRNLEAREFKDERDPRASGRRPRRAQIPLQPRRQVQGIHVPKSVGAPGGKPV
jgi:hypothetical protein